MTRILNIAIITLGAAALTWTAHAGAADEASVTYVDSVYCQAGACEVRHKTVAVTTTVREQFAGGICAEYTRRIAGFRKVSSLDPAVPLEVPQFETGMPQWFRCADRAGRTAAGPALASAPSTPRN